MCAACAQKPSGPVKALAPTGDTATFGTDEASAAPDPGPTPMDEGPGPTDPGPADSGPTDPGPADPGATDPGGEDIGPDVPDPPATTAWTLAVLPDTQYYAKSFPWVFDAQTQWLADNHEALGIAFVLHEGDIVHNNNTEQWANARGSIDTLVDAKVPFALAPGNHDYGDQGSANERSTQLDLFFGVEDYAQTPTVLLYEDGSIQSSAHLFEAGGRKYLALALEFAPRHDVVAWADEVVSAHPDRDVILVTHAYMYYEEVRYDWAKYGPSQSWSPHKYGLADEPGGVNDGEELWQKLVRKHPRFRFTLNGHVLGDGLAWLPSLGDGGNVVHQILANYQTGVQPAQPEGGGGFLRLMTFEADGKTVTVQTYSPYLNEWLTDPANDFVVSLDGQDYDYLLGAESYPVLRIEDDPNNATLSPCDKGPITSPGADIDAALLIDAGDVVADLTDCDLGQVTACDNDNNNPSKAHGAPDAPGSEAGGNYVSLNGGALTCAWSEGATVDKGAGQVIEVHEIGGSVENYRFELCVEADDPLSCTTVSSYGTGIMAIPVDDVFF